MFIWGILTIVHSNIAMFAIAKFPPYQLKPEKEIRKQIELMWKDFKNERDAYLLKKTGSKYPIVTATAPDISISMQMTMSSPWELGFKEYYVIKPIHMVDVSKFQEALGYQEPLRIDYANKAEEFLKHREDIGEKNRQFARDVSCISFADAYHFAVGTITGTDRKSYNDFMDQARSYKRQIVEYLTGKEAFSARAWFSSDQGAAELTDLPVFQHDYNPLSENLSRASGAIFILLAWNITLFMGVYVSFLRYEIN